MQSDWGNVVIALRGLRATMCANPSGTVALKHMIRDMCAPPALLKMDQYAVFREAARVCTHNFLEWLVMAYEYTDVDHWRDGGGTLAAAATSDAEPLLKVRFLFDHLGLGEADALALLCTCTSPTMARVLAARLRPRMKSLAVTDAVLEAAVEHPPGAAECVKRGIVEALSLPLCTVHHTTAAAAIRALAAAGDAATLRHLHEHGLVTRETVEANQCVAYVGALAGGHVAVAQWLAQFMVDAPAPALTFLAACRAGTTAALEEAITRAAVGVADMGAVKWEAAQLLVARDEVDRLVWLGNHAFPDADMPRLHRATLEWAAQWGAAACLEWLLAQPTVWAAGAFGLDFAAAAAVAVRGGHLAMATRLRELVADADFAAAARRTDMLASATPAIVEYVEAALGHLDVTVAALEGAARRRDVDVFLQLAAHRPLEGLTVEEGLAVWRAACAGGDADLIKALVRVTPHDHTRLLCTGNLALLLQMRDEYGVWRNPTAADVEAMCAAGCTDAVAGLHERGALALPLNLWPCVVAAAGAGHVHTLEWLARQRDRLAPPAPALPTCGASALAVLDNHDLLAGRLLTGRFLAAAVSRNDVAVVRWVMRYHPPAPRLFLERTMVGVTCVTPALEWAVDTLGACPPSAATLRQCKPAVREWALHRFCTAQMHKF